VTTFQIIIRKFWIRVEKPIWSFIVNCVFWLFRLNKIGQVRRELVLLKDWKLQPMMELFTWKEDKGGDWTSWVSTLIWQYFNGDCDDAAQLAKWWFKQNGVEADILNLYSATEGHTICVTKDRTKMVSNRNVMSLNPDTWEQDVMQYFNNEYEVII
jgi:hypothetical protein